MDTVNIDGYTITIEQTPVGPSTRITYKGIPIEIGAPSIVRVLAVELARLREVEAAAVRLVVGNFEGDERATIMGHAAEPAPPIGFDWAMHADTIAGSAAAVGNFPRVLIAPEQVVSIYDALRDIEADRDALRVHVYEMQVALGVILKDSLAMYPRQLTPAQLALAFKRDSEERARLGMRGLCPHGLAFAAPCSECDDAASAIMRDDMLGDWPAEPVPAVEVPSTLPGVCSKCGGKAAVDTVSWCNSCMSSALNLASHSPAPRTCPTCPTFLRPGADNCGRPGCIPF